ncbi:MAG: Fe-S cluster assembly protein NifU [Verrucomicrobia bacterium]|nr:Fe-S cluster assembly protein NifU [Verrucomicrobiota bacterium]
MWDYSDKVLEHFRHPRNVGVIKNPDGVGEVGSMACGDALKLTFKLDAQGRLADVKFQTFGCASAIASSSALTEIVKGLTLDEAAQVTNQDIANYLGGLPEQKMHCSVMGREALELAIDNYRTGKTAKKILEGKVICHCFGVTEEEIERVVRDNRLATIEQVTNYCKVGGACGKCHGDIAAIIARVCGEQPPTAVKPPPAPRLTTLQKIKLIEETMEKEIRPALKKDGGDIELIDVVDNRVQVALRGMCANCQVARFTLKDVVEAKLREFVAPDLVVEEVPS